MKVFRTVINAAVAMLCHTAMAGSAAPTSTIEAALNRSALQVHDPAHAVMLAATEAGTSLVAVGERGLIAIREAGSKNWQQQKSPTSVTLTAVRFVDSLIGIAVGHGGLVLLTRDGGRTWNPILDGRKIAQQVLTEAKVSADPLRIKDAERLESDGPDKPLLDVVAWDAQNLLVVGAYGIAFRTSDGGKTWKSWMSRLPNPRGLHLYAAGRKGNVLLIGGEQGLLMVSGDGGNTFKSLRSPYRGSWFSVDANSENEWVVAGLRGNAWRTSNGGTNWTQLGNPISSSITASLRSRDGALLLVNQAGFVMRLQGDTLVPLNEKPLPPLAGLSFDSQGQLWTLSVTGPIPVNTSH